MRITPGPTSHAVTCQRFQVRCSRPGNPCIDHDLTRCRESRSITKPTPIYLRYGTTRYHAGAMCCDSNAILMWDIRRGKSETLVLSFSNPQSWRNLIFVAPRRRNPPIPDWSFEPIPHELTRQVVSNPRYSQACWRRSSRDFRFPAWARQKRKRR